MRQRRTSHNITTTFYDATYTYPIRIVYPATESGTVAHEVEMTYDNGYGVIADSWDENDNHTQYAYDHFGRLLDVYYPDGGHVQYIYDDMAFPGSSTIDTYQYFDGLGRPIKSVSYGENGQPITTTNEYDDMGRNFRNNGPFFGTGSPPAQSPYVETTYDYRGRPSTITSPDTDYGCQGPGHHFRL
jgi:YD repeat-containing protein